MIGDKMFIKSKSIQFIPATEQAKQFPPKPAKMKLPNWYKQMDTRLDGHELTAISMHQTNFPSTIFTAKKCIPMQDYMLNGYTLFTNTEILLTVVKVDDETQNFIWAVPTTNDHVIASHNYEQCPVRFEGKRHNYIKLYSGWGIKTPPGYSCLFTQPFYDIEERFTLFPAIVDTDTYHDAVGFIGYLNPKETNIRLEVGTPVMNVFPFKRDNWKMSVVGDVMERSKTKFKILNTQFYSDVYRNFFHAKKRFD